jgi:hypothetical protein
MPQARRFDELEVEGTATEIPALRQPARRPERYNGRTEIDSRSSSVPSARSG